MKIDEELEDRIRRIRERRSMGNAPQNPPSGLRISPIPQGTIIDDVPYKVLEPLNTKEPEMPDKKIGNLTTTPLQITDTRQADSALKEEKVSKNIKEKFFPGAENTPTDEDEKGEKTRNNFGLEPSYIEKEERRKTQESTSLRLVEENDELTDLLSDHNNLKFNGDFGYLSDQEKILEQNKQDIESRNRAELEKIKLEDDRKNALIENANKKAEVLKRQKIEEAKKKIEKVDSLEKLFELGCEYLHLIEQSKKDEFRDKICDYVYKNKIREKPELIEVGFYNKLNSLKKDFQKKIENVDQKNGWEDIEKYLNMTVFPNLLKFSEDKEIIPADVLKKESIVYYKYFGEKRVLEMYKKKKFFEKSNLLILYESRVQKHLKNGMTGILAKILETKKPFRIGIAFADEIINNLSKKNDFVDNVRKYSDLTKELGTIFSLNFEDRKYDSAEDLFLAIIKSQMVTITTDLNPIFDNGKNLEKLKASVGRNRTAFKQIFRQTLTELAKKKDLKVLEYNDTHYLISNNDHIDVLAEVLYSISLRVV